MYLKPATLCTIMYSSTWVGLYHVVHTEQIYFWQTSQTLRSSHTQGWKEEEWLVWPKPSQERTQWGNVTHSTAPISHSHTHTLITQPWTSALVSLKQINYTTWNMKNNSFLKHLLYEFVWIQLIASNIEKLKNLELSLLSLPLLTPCNKSHWSYYTSSSSFLLLPVTLPPSLLLFTPSTGKKVPPAFLAIKGQKQTRSWQPSLSLGSGYRRREEGGRGGGWPKKEESNNKKKKKKREKCCVGHF